MANKLLTLLTLIFLVFGMSAVIASDDGTVTNQVILPTPTISGNPGTGGVVSGMISSIVNSDGSVSLTNARRVCVINPELMKELKKLVELLEDAEKNNDDELVNKLTEKIKAIKMETDREMERCRASGMETAQVRILQPTITPINTESIYNDVCSQIDRYVEKRKHYELLYQLSDDELEDKGYSSEDGKERIKRTINELNEEINRIRIKCKLRESGSSESGSSGGGSGATEDSVEAKPIVISSGNEISSYYKVKMSQIMVNELGIDVRIRELKELRNEIDGFIEELIKSKDEVNADELAELVDEIKIKPGIIEADGVVVNSVNKKLFVMIKNKNLTIEPQKLHVIINDGGIKIKSTGLMIRNNTLTMYNSEIKILASDIAIKLKLQTKEMELKKENNKLVYKIKSMENRRLFGIIPVEIENDLTVDAETEEVNVIQERLPWWVFLTVK